MILVYLLVQFYLFTSLFLLKEVRTGSYNDITTSVQRRKDRFRYQQHSNSTTGAVPNRDVVTIYDDFLYEELDLSLMDKESCINLRPDCDRYAASGGCTSDPVWMLPHCPVSCNACSGDVSAHGTTTDPVFTFRSTPQRLLFDQSFGFREMKDITATSMENAIQIDGILPPQRLVGGHETAIRQHVRRVQRYLQTVVDVDPVYAPVRLLCRSAVQHTDCAFWASVQDLCSGSPKFMKEHGCTLFCRNCEVLHIEAVCPIDINEKSAWYAPNDLNEMFLSILEQTVYNITVLSRPSLEPDEDEDDDISLSEDAPWVLQIDEFLSAEEAAVLIQLGADIGYVRSTETGELDASGQQASEVSYRRTSTNAWCNTQECNDHPVMQNLYERIYSLTQIPSEHSEPLQLLRYEVGQFYKVHHDYVDIEVQQQHGVRIFTFFFYLNTMEENGGGGTRFPRLNLTVHPVLGRAILWPNVLNHAPNVQDDRTSHQALVVERGVKYGANAWYHQRPLRCDAED
jgi:prolyl 4-hydroxylase